MTSSSVLSSISSIKSSSILSTREYLIRTKTSHNHRNDFERDIILRIFDDQQHFTEEIILKKSKSEYQSNDNKNIDRYHIQTEQKLSDIIQKLKLHTTNTQNQQSENNKNKRIFLKWIELTDLNTKHTFCFPVNDYLPSSSGDALELTEVHENKICEENNQQEINIKNEKSNLHSKPIPSTSNLSETKTSTLIEDKSKYAKLYDIRTKTGQQGFLGIKSLIKANVYLKFYDINHQSSESIPLTISNLHQQPFRSNQTDQFQIGTKNKLDRLEKVEIWHDGNKGTRLHCDTLEITDLDNGQIYCFQIKGYLDGDQKFLLTDYDNRRCLKIHSEHEKSSKNDPTIYQTSEDEPSITSINIQTTQKKPSTTVTNSISNSTNTDINQTLFKVRTKVGHKGFLSLGMGGTDANVYLRIHEGNNITNDILLNNSLTHNNPFEAGHIDVFEIGVPDNIISPDQIEIFHNGKKHDGLYLKWIEIMNMKTLERKCFPVNRWLDSNENDKKTHLILTNFTLDESCEENEYHDHHTHDQYKTEYIIRTKTSQNQPINQNDTYANIYLKIYNNKTNHTEDMLLNNSKNHRKPFQVGKIDQFDIGTIQLMDDNIDKIELWHDNKSDFNWLCEWIEIKNKKTGNIKCFSVNRLLSRKFSDGITKIPLTIQSNHPCDQIEHELNDLVKNTPIHTNKMQYLKQKHYHSLDKQDFKKKYIIKTRTGNKILSGTNANVFIRLYDDQNQESEDILLEQTVTNKIPFEKHTIDEFHVGTLKNLLDLKKIHLWHTGGKNQGWNVEWIQIQDLQTNRLYCFPVNKWLDSNSGERTTYVELTEFTVDQPCTIIPSRKDQKILQRSTINDNDDDENKKINQSTQFKQTYHVQTKTGKKGFLGLSPTGTNAKVHIRIHDQNGQISQPIELDKSTNHKNKFERGQTDEFDVGSIQSLNGIDKLEVWHNDTGIGRGWFVDYIAITDNKTGEEACFFIGKYLNNENGGVEEKHLILDKQPIDNRPCREHQFDVQESTIQQSMTTRNISSPFTQTYRVETKTGHTGLFGLGGAGTNAPVFIRIHDNNDKISESIRLKNSLRHKNKFERNQTDQFDVGTRQNLDGIKKLELWHEGDKNDGWQVDYIQIIDNQTGDSYCFLVNAMLDQNSGLKDTHILLENPSINVLCSDQFKTMKTNHHITSISTTNSKKSDEIQRHFTIRTKTGNHVEDGSTKPIHIQLFDDKEQKSEDIRLKHKDHDKHNFEPGAIDIFDVISFQPLSDQLIGIGIKHNADKYQGWYAEWIEVIDEDNQKTYCYPIQRWIDKAENDQQTALYFTNTSNIPCDSLPEIVHQSIPTVRKAPTNTTSSLTPQSQTSAQTPKIPLKNTYHIKTKTGKKGFLGLSPTGTNAKVFMRIIDKDGNISENLQLHRSIDHKNKFERGQTDEFDIGTNKQLNNIDQIELWTDDKGLGSGWFPEYIQITDNKTGNMTCFPINQYLNEKNGGIEGNPLRLKRLIDNQPCQQLIEETHDNDNQSVEQNTLSNLNKTPSLYKNTFLVTTKTGHTGFLGLGAAGTNAPVFIRIHDTKGKISEAIQLKNSTRHTNKFERNQTDQFDIGTRESLVGVSRIELWHEGGKNDGWQVEYVQIYDNQTDTSYCFPIYSMLDTNSGLKQTHILLEKPFINVSCPDQIESLKRDQINSDINSSKKKKEKYERNFTIRTKTGDQIEASPTTPIHIQLFDDQEQYSEDIRLKHQDHNKLNFEPGAIDEFQVTSNQPLSNRLIGIRIKHKADKYQGWYCDWIEITDDDNEQTYCFPIQRWIDKGESDKKTDMYFTDISNILCDSSINTKMISDRSTIPNNRKEREIESQKSPLSSKISSIPFQNTYHVETKTGKKGFLGLSPTGTNADVYIRIIDRDGNKSEPIQLKSSTDHKNKFERDKTDEFDIGSIKSLNGIKQLEVWTDGKGFGHGWYADYISVKDNKTNEEACFLIDQYLNKEYGGVADDHLLLDKQTDDIPCRDKYRKNEDDIDTIQTRQMKAIKPNTTFTKESSSSVIAYKRTYHVDTKTGQKGFLNLSPTGTNADVYLRIHDKLGHVSEPISLSRSTKHSNPFEKGKTDSFDIGTKESLESISKLELYHNGTGLGHGWNLEYINILDNITGHTYCFSANKWLNNTEHLILDNYVLDVSCEDINQELIQSKIDSKDEEQKRSFTVRTKTGSQIEASSTTPIYIRLFDDHSQKSEKIRLAQKNQDGHHFEAGSIDEFHITSDQPLNTLTGIEISHKAEKHQGWYGEWISITDNDTNQIFCFPLQRWLDKGELDGKTKIYLQRLPTSIPCEQLPDAMQRQNLTLTNTSNQRSNIKDITEDYKSKYHIQVKTAKKGLLGLSPTGTDANVFIQIHDNDGNISQPIQLKNSLDHKNKFTRGKIDNFDVGSKQQLNGVNKLELWTDGKGLGSGWYPEYIRITDEETGEINCFIIEQYLNEKYGGVKNEHLILNKQNDTKLCQESKQEEIINQIKQNSFQNKSQSQGRFQVEVKTGHTGFLGLAGAGTDAPVFIQIYDSQDKKSEIIQLKNSTRHKNKFERNQTDHFIVDTKEPLNDVAKIDLWHEGTKNDGWQVDYINIFDNKTNTSYCFPINSMLDKNSGIKQTIIHLKNPSINAFCKEQTEALMKKTHSYTSVSKKLKSDKLNENYTIQVKTGNHPSAGSTTPIYIQLIDINNKKSKHIRLEKKDFEGHHFAPGNIDEFKINLSESLSTIKGIKISLDADKGQGWYGEWISIINDNNGQISCFPIQRWLDKGENDHKTHITLYQQSNIPCHQILDSIKILSNETFLNQNNQFEIRTKTADKSLRGKSDNHVHVYLNIYNKNNQQIGNSIQLENSQTYSIPFEKHHIDQFYLSIPNLNLSDINRIDLYHDGENDGWFCDFVQFKNIQTNEIKCFSVHQWLDELSDKLHFSMTNYQNIPCQE